MHGDKYCTQGHMLFLLGWSDAHYIREYDDHSNSNDLHMYSLNLDSFQWSSTFYGGDPPSLR